MEPDPEGGEKNGVIVQPSVFFKLKMDLNEQIKDKPEGYCEETG